jgi:hypothetical protein
MKIPVQQKKHFGIGDKTNTKQIDGLRRPSSRKGGIVERISEPLRQVL